MRYINLRLLTFTYLLYRLHGVKHRTDLAGERLLGQLRSSRDMLLMMMMMVVVINAKLTEPPHITSKPESGHFRPGQVAWTYMYFHTVP